MEQGSMGSSAVAYAESPSATSSVAVATQRVIIVDDHELIREGLCRTLEHTSDLQVSAQLGSGAELLEYLKTESAEQADIALVDLAMPGLSGMQLLREVRAAMPRLPILVLSSYPDFMKTASRMGVEGYVLKSESAERILHAVRAVLAGESYYTDAGRIELSEDALLSGEIPPDILSNREREVLELVATGMKNTEVADELDVSLRTVEFHKANIKEKLRLNTNGELIRYALTHDIIA